MNYEIKAKHKPYKFGEKLDVGNIIFFYDEIRQVHIFYKVEDITSKYILVRKRAYDGVPIKRNERTLEKFTEKSMNDYDFYFIADKTYDQHLWPVNIKQALIKLKSLYNEKEYSLMQNMTWEQFNDKFNHFGGLSQWIRNYFGLYRGNFELLDDFDIDEPDADNVSSILVYYFWESIKDDK